MTKYRFTKILKHRIEKYLTGKQGFKGQEMNYSRMEMSDYLLPTNKNLTIDQKRRLFAIKNKMIDIPSNFSSKIENRCQCGEIENMEHIYICEILNKERRILPYEKIYNGNLSEQIDIFQIFERNLEIRERKQTETEIPCDPDVIRCISSIG